MVRCPVCGTMHHQTVVDLHHQPLALSFEGKVSDSLKIPLFPLKLLRCYRCNHIFVNTIAAPKAKPPKQSDTSKHSNIKHFKYFAEKIINEVIPLNGTLNKSRKRSILELSCNDGSQLDQFRAIGWDTYGVDPVAKVVSTATAKGHKVEVGNWGSQKFKHIPSPNLLDVILAHNVIAYILNPITFLTSCMEIMGPTSKLYIQTSQCNMFQTGQFDTAYHEHTSFFTGHSFFLCSKYEWIGNYQFRNYTDA